MKQLYKELPKTRNSFVTLVFYFKAILNRITLQYMHVAYMCKYACLTVCTILSHSYSWKDENDIVHS